MMDDLGVPTHIQLFDADHDNVSYLPAGEGWAVDAPHLDGTDGEFATLEDARQAVQDAAASKKTRRKKAAVPTKRKRTK